MLHLFRKNAVTSHVADIRFVPIELKSQAHSRFSPMCTSFVGTAKRPAFPSTAGIRGARFEVRSVAQCTASCSCDWAAPNAPAVVHHPDKPLVERAVPRSVFEGHESLKGEASSMLVSEPKLLRKKIVRAKRRSGQRFTLRKRTQRQRRGPLNTTVHQHFFSFLP